MGTDPPLRFAMRFLLLAFALATPIDLDAVQAKTDSSKEIARLFTLLESSKCEFNRNGAWYSAGEASAHLHRKYAYLQKKRALTTTESFIERAATRSSVSGKPYLVRCGNAAPIPSKLWFSRKLDLIRK